MTDKIYQRLVKADVFNDDPNMNKYARYISSAVLEKLLPFIKEKNPEIMEVVYIWKSK